MYLMDGSPHSLHSEEHFRPGWTSTALRERDLHDLVGVWPLMFYSKGNLGNLESKGIITQTYMKCPPQQYIDQYDRICMLFVHFDKFFFCFSDSGWICLLCIDT